MKKNNLKDIAELIGIAAIVASLIFVGIQLQQEQEIAIVDTYGSVAETEINLSIQVGENIAVWRKGLEGENLTEEEMGKFLGLAAAVESQYQRNYIRWFRLGPGNPDAIASEFAYALYIFPGLKNSFEDKLRFDALRDEARGFGSDLSPWETNILSYLSKFEEDNLPIPDSKSYIFWTI
jgi:hypothetical protein